LAIENISLEIQVQLELDHVDLPGRVRRQLIERLTPIFASIDQQFAAIREHIGMDEEPSS